jgi:hypothetical protein
MAGHEPRATAKATPRLDDSRSAPRGKRDVALGEHLKRHLRAFSQPGQRPTPAVQAKQDAVIPVRSGAETGIAKGS